MKEDQKNFLLFAVIAGLLLFYAVFFSFMWVRAQQLSSQLRRPITGISQMMREIGRGNRRPARVSSDIGELDEMAGHAVDLGAQLERSEAQGATTQQRLELVLESATESLWELNFDTRLVSLRGRFAERFGLPGSEISDDAFIQRVHPDVVARPRAGQCLLREPRAELRDARAAPPDRRPHA